MCLKEHRNTTRIPKWLTIFSLIFAGEIIFSLPFHIPRYFRPTLLEVFKLSNTEFGDAFVMYGIMAMISYFPGGMIADRISPRKLITLSLVATALGGAYFAMIPGQTGLFVLFGYWGITTVFLLWAAMIRATREWGGQLTQGRAFGLLDGGRGLVAAGAASGAVLVFGIVMPDDLAHVNLEFRTRAIQSVIYFYSLAILVVAVVTWFFIPESVEENPGPKKSMCSGIRYVLRSRSVWLQAIIVVSAYVGYKGLDFYTSYAVEILNMDEVSAAWYMSNATYLRAITAIGSGFLADRISSRKVIAIAFTMALFCYVVLSTILPDHLLYIIYANLFVTFIAVYALRGVYFALLEETSIHKTHTGTAVGLISVIGFTPDAFFYSAGGRIIDASPGLPGYHHYFTFLAIFALTGIIATILIRKKTLT